MNKKTMWIVIAAVVVVVGIAAVYFMGKGSNEKSNTTTSSSQSTPGSENTQNTESNQQPAVNNDVSTNVSVEIKDFAFAPATLTVSKGTTVTWTNKDSVGHTVTPDEPSDNFEGSDLIAQNKTYSFTFDTPGTYTYHCQPHPNMKAKVVVTE